jgi:hypothetical protein
MSRATSAKRVSILLGMRRGRGRCAAGGVVAPAGAVVAPRARSLRRGKKVVS